MLLLRGLQQAWWLYLFIDAILKLYARQKSHDVWAIRMRERGGFTLAAQEDMRRNVCSREACCWEYVRT